MKEFIDKLIERLEEEHERCINQYGIVGGNVPASIVKRCMNIVEELAEEYNNGWIPLEEKLPYCGSAVLILLKNKSDGITMDDGATCDISWLRTEDYFISSQGKYKYEDVIAWQPLPAPYTEGE